MTLRTLVNNKMNTIINKLRGSVSPVPANALFRDFLNIKFNDVINAIGDAPINKKKGTIYAGTDNISFVDRHLIVDNKTYYVGFSKFGINITDIQVNVNTNTIYIEIEPLSEDIGVEVVIL